MFFRILTLFLVLSTSVFAQSAGWEELTISEGLSQGMIYDIKQDRQGFMWIATNDGLNRYDGHNFKVFTHNPYDDLSISGNTCTALLIDSNGRLWIGTQTDGLNVYDDQNRRFYHIAIQAKSRREIGNCNITFLKEDPEGNIWAGTLQGEAFKVILPAALRKGAMPQENLIKEVQVKNIGLPISGNPTTLTTLFQPNGEVYIWTSENIYVTKWKNPKQLRVLKKDPSQLSVFRRVHRDSRGRTWVVSAAPDISFWDNHTLKTIALLGENNFHTTVHIQSLHTGKLMVASKEYLWVMSSDELLQQSSLTPQNALSALKKQNIPITCLFEDQTGTIWVGTAGYGLQKFNPQVKQFRAYLPNMPLYNVYQDRQSRIYVWYQYGYYLLNKQFNSAQPILASKVNTSPDSSPPNLFDLWQDASDNFWLAAGETSNGQQNHYLLKYDQNWQLLKKYPLPPTIRWIASGTKILEDPAGQLWVTAINEKLIRFDPVKETHQVFNYEHLASKTSSLKEPSALYQDHQGTLWIGTKGGLVKTTNSQSKPQFSLLSNSATNRQSLSNNYVSALMDDPYQPHRYLWVSTKGGGLERLDKQSGTFEHFTEAQGLANKVVYGILEDERKNLWMSTNRGLSQLNPKTLIFKNYTKGDGLQGDEFNTNSFFKAPTSELLFGGLNGLNIFRASDLQNNTSKPSLKIVELKINNKPVEVGDESEILTQALERTKRITLAHDQNQISLEVAVMDFTNPAKNRYRYQLEGIDEEWVEMGTNRMINFSQLPDGNYTLRVSGSSNGEIWSTPVALEIRIKPPFYRTWWAYLLYVIMVAMVGWRWYRAQTQRLLLHQNLLFEQKETERLAELDGLKTQFFTNISHEFRTPLTLILGASEQLTTTRTFNNSNVSMIQRNAHRLLSLINQLLDLSKLEAKQLEPTLQQGDIIQLMRVSTAAFESLAQSRQIQFRAELPATALITNFDADMVEKIINNLLSNAFKFTEAEGKVSFECQLTTSLDTPNRAANRSALEIQITDTGIGIAPDQLPHIFDRFYQADSRTNRNYEGTGIGLALVKELVDVLKGTIAVESTLGVGTAFTLRLPVEEISQKNAPDNGKELADGFRLGKRLVRTPATELERMAGADNYRGMGQNSEPLVGVRTDHSNSKFDNLLLLVDDNADIRAFVRSIFEADYQIIEAQDGIEGLEKAQEFTPDLIISDLMMPRMDGFEFCQKLKTDEKTSHIPIIMLTAKATLQDRLEGFGYGADEYLTKPFNQQEIKVRVQNLIRQRERLQKYYGGMVVEDKDNTGKNPPIEEPHYSPLEDAFLRKAKAVTERHLSDSSFGVEQFSDEMNLSASQLRRKLKALTNQNSVEFIREIRLQRAIELLSGSTLPIAEIAFQVGFESAPYFSRAFQERFGVSPSEYPTKA